MFTTKLTTKIIHLELIGYFIKISNKKYTLFWVSSAHLIACSISALCYAYLLGSKLYCQLAQYVQLNAVNISFFQQCFCQKKSKN